jgi:hypothetical protein
MVDYFTERAAAENGTPHGTVPFHPSEAPSLSPGAPALAVSSPAPPGPRAPRIEDTIDLDGYGYPGHQVRVWLNFPQKLFAQMQSGTQEAMVAALSRIVLAHNGWLDEDGVPYPPPSDPAFWEAVPTHQAVALLRAIVTRVTQAPLAAGTRRP